MSDPIPVTRDIEPELVTSLLLLAEMAAAARKYGVMVSINVSPMSEADE